MTLYFHKLSFSKAHPDAPQAEEALGYTQESIEPFSPTFKIDLDNQATKEVSENKWWCDSQPRDPQLPGLNIALALSKSIYLFNIQKELTEIFSRGITQIGLLGQVKKTKSLPPLNRHTQNPTISWKLDPPPPSDRQGYIEDNQLVWVYRTPTQDCQIWISWQTNVDLFFQVGEEAQKECHNLFLILSKP